MKFKLHIFFFSIITFTLLVSAKAQTVPPQLLRHQAILRDWGGQVYQFTNVSIKAGIYAGSVSGTPVWEETHSVITDATGLYVINIGGGTSTGAGSLSSFNLIPWGSSSFYLKIAADYSGGTSYIDIGNAELLSVPYSFYSLSTGSYTLSLNDLADADTAGAAIGNILKWNGTNWIPARDNHHDTVLFSYNSIPNWHLAGNASPATDFLGTLDTNHFVIKTNATEKMRITNTGKWAIGNTSPFAQAQFSGNDGMQHWGADSLGTPSDTATGTKFYWYPKKAALRIGQVTDNSWTDSNIGYTSFAEGLNAKAAGRYSLSMGINNNAKSLNCIAIGRNNYAAIDSGATAYGGCVAIGDSNYIYITRGIALGYHNDSEDGMCIGYRNRARTGTSSAAFGKDNTADGFVSIALGTKASSAGYKGCFAFADATGAIMRNSAINQFMVRASGGVVLFSDSLQTTGVQLFPGGGSWASVSDKKKKENFNEESPEEILNKITQLKITQWNYKAQNRRIHHIGPMAQQFHSLFGVGENDTSISTVDIDGVCLSGLKALEKQTTELAEKINQIDSLKAELKSDIDFNSLENRLQRIEQTLNNLNK
jgi:hypothetical protein